ncbi:AAA family ATPase [Streptomyces lunaelactis]|uniref:helix-turn-helix transcriptional regulator n=1 Tax=Streptomyces lunaelactis TaxID=1535768 RepID=UPI001584D0B4|nr:LuxR family transcriptional regulator [Streptomyces lunaelactis]NUL02167.1 AAA family ATPase [Streptomyces lunaelactis]
MPEALFFGRADELSRMSDRLDRAMRSEPQTVVVDGPAGIGKTSLARRFRASLDPSCCVLWASGEEIEMQLPYGVVTHLLSHVQGAPDLPLQGLDCCARPGTALPDPIVVGASLIDALGRFQDHAPVVMVIDDAHWADTPSLHALTFVLRRLRVDRVLTVITTRDAAHPRLPGGLRRILHDDTTLKLTLGGLSVSELTALNSALGSSLLPRGAVARLREHTHGNPLHTRALLQQFSADVLGTRSTFLPAPRGYERLIAERLDDCSPRTRRLVGAVSVLGMSSPLHMAAQVGAVPDPLEALAEAMARELLEEGTVGAMPKAVFPHPLLRAAVYHSLEPAERSRLHGLAAGLSDDPGTALQHQFHAAVGPDAELANELGLFAAQQSGEGAWSAAASASMAAARLSTDRALREQRMLQAVEYLLLAGDVSQAAELEQSIREMAPGAEQHYVLGHLALTAGRLDEARRELTACWESCDAATGTETIRCAVEQMAWLCLIQGDAQSIVDWARRGLDLPPGNRSSFLRDSLAIGLAISGDYEEAMKSLAHLPVSGPRNGPEQLDGLLARGMLQLWNGQLGDACRDLKDAFASHRRGGLPYATLVSLGFLTDAEYRAGLWDDAIAHGTQAVSLAEDTDQVSILAVVHAFTACPLAGRGNFQAAEAHATAAAEHARVLGDVNDTAFASTALALVRSAQGDYESVVAELSPFLAQEITHRRGIDEVGIVHWRPLLVEALVRTDRMDEAAQVLTPYETRAADRRRWLDQAAAARCRGILEGARGDVEAAERAFRTGLNHCDRGEPCWEEALLRLSYGTFLRRVGRRSSAVPELQAAWRTFHRLQAAPYLDRCETELAACGRVAARRQGGRHPVLTAQELTVARLAARGMTNGQIARELLLSVKTIEYHLSNAYAKLGIASRMDLADKLTREV